MSLLKLDIFSLRNIQQAHLEPLSSINLITGDNASGKSSLLEAIFILGRARSYRTHYVKQAIAFDSPHLIVSAQSRQHNDSLCYLGIQIDSKQQEIRINQETAHKVDLAYAFPVQIIHPNSYRLLDGGPQYRREFLDWGVFNHNKLFLAAWRQYSKALQHRNAILKTRQVRQLSVWDRELCEHGSAIAVFRQEYVTELQPVFTELAQYFLRLDSVTMHFQQGWDVTMNLQQSLASGLEKDLRYGCTHNGPHRADLQIHCHGRPARDFMSRGQQKLLVLALILSQVKLLNIKTDNQCCILIDDMTAELDTENTGKLLKYLAELGCQVFMASTALSDFGNLANIEHYKVFHVEHGCIKQI